MEHGQEKQKEEKMSVDACTQGIGAAAEASQRGTWSGRACIGKYTVLGQLGAGGEGRVYLARDEALHRLVAVKQMVGAAQDRQIAQEADLLRQLRHPMLPVVYELLQDEEWYLVMEYIRGLTLREYIERNGYVEEAQACAWAGQVLSVLSYLHERKPPVIYRDLKPDNLIVTTEGNLRLVDFGAAVRRPYGERSDGVMAATPGYAAPEQLQHTASILERDRGGAFDQKQPDDENGASRQERLDGSGSTRQPDAASLIGGGVVYADERSDLYALGKLMYYMVTGADPAKPPYTSLSVRDYQPLVSDRMERVIRRCIEREPARRYQMTEEVGEALRQCGQKAYRPRRRSFIRAVEQRVWLYEE